ncbi:MAG: PDZ domain-containing protein [Anaerolineae bacterium]
MDDNTKRIIVIALLVLAALFDCALALIGGTLGGYLGARVALREVRARISAPEVETPRSWQKDVPWPPTPRLEIQWAALVIQVEPDSPAEEAGIEPGDRIIAVDNTALTEEDTLRELVQGYRPGEQVTLSILRDGNSKRVRVRLASPPDGPNDIPWLGIRFQMVPLAPELEP